MIQKLVAIDVEAQCITVQAHQAILVLEDDLRGLECLYLKEIDGVQELIEKLSPYKNFSKFKFFGPEKIFDLLKTLDASWINNCEHKVINNKESDVWYFPKTGKIRIPTEKKKRKVLIIDDSKVIQKLLSKIISKSANLEVMAVADYPSMATKIIEQTRPDIITLDIHMPEQNGLEYLKSYLGAKKIPVVMISSVNISEGEIVMEALSNGAQSYIQKPTVEEMQDVAQDIIEKLETIQIKENTTPDPKFLAREKFGDFKDTQGMIVIGSSTGGTNALEVLLTRLPEQIPPIIIVQHIPSVFSLALANRLNGLCPFTVQEAKHNEPIMPNNVYIAPGDKQLKLKRVAGEVRCIVTDDPPLNRFRPSVDYLFDSIPELNIKKLVGLILTGMGKDGAKGLLKLKNGNARTLAQDEKTSVVFGMPKEAIALNAVHVVSSIDDMAKNIILEYNKIT